MWLTSLIAPPLCWGCAGRTRAGLPLCRGCRAALRWLPAQPVRLGGMVAWAPLSYEGPARELVRALKFHAAEALAGTMAAAVAANAPPGLLRPAGERAPPAAVLVPVPLHPARRRRRGFNQAERIAAALAARTGLAVADCLTRAPGPHQVGRPRGARAAVAGVRAGRAPPPAALIVDDVLTTGGTVAACGRALREAGCERVAAVAYARTLAR